MPRSIAFTNIETSTNGVLRCALERDGERDELWFELPHAFEPAPDLIASAFATLCGTAFDEVRIDAPIGPDTAKAIEDATRASVVHLPGSDRQRAPGRGHALNFSGGFDSLAAYALLPSAHLVSLGFGGRFAREEPVFSRFSPYIIRTNLVDLGLNLNHWAFMGLGSILLRDELELGTYSFGSIQAGSLPKLFTGPVNQKRLRVSTAGDMGIANPVAGVSEIGAVSIAAQTHPELLADVLASVSHPGELKYHRKRLMLQAVAKCQGITLELPDAPALDPKPEWGRHFADDLASLYVMKVMGPETVAATYEGGIPPAVLDWVDTTELAFMERFNPHAYAGLDRITVADWYSRLVTLGLMPYARQDWFDAAAAMKAIRGQLKRS